MQLLTAQAPFVQLSLAFGRLQIAPHAPQLAVVFSGVSQPFDALRSQSAKPGEQMSPHVPLVHTAVAFAPVAQVVRQLPQLAGSLRVATQRPSHDDNGDGHNNVHEPPTQVSRSAQRLSHRPQ